MKKIAALAVLSLSVGAIATTLDRRDEPKGPGPMAGGLAALMKMPVQKALKIESIPTKINKQAKRYKLTYGPYKIKAANDPAQLGTGKSMDPHGTGYNYLAGDDFPKDITILESKSDMVNEQMKRVDLAEGLYDHHHIFSDLNRPGTPLAQCGTQVKTSSPVSIFIAGAMEQGSMQFVTPKANFKSGFYIGKNDRIMITVDMVNYNNASRNVYSVSEIEFLPGKLPGMLFAEQTNFDIGLCGGQDGGSIHAPQGQTKFSVTGREITMAADGYLTHFRGHMHDGGKDLVIKLNGKQICSSKAIYGGAGHEGVGTDGKPWATVSEMTECPGAIKVKKGDKMLIEANFDTEAHPMRESAHGEMAEGMAKFAGIWVNAHPMA